ncbi:MAG: type IV pilus assembly protein PilM [Akkermansia sp.]|nr:type IV pilus assembly protein PilM [Akkermansia sp.]MBQ4635462.1 type IV pilus assembly protein PilM [Akkermansia sp.]MBQ9095323.1 type IV pilus assembly protein PilM [Akkermansia sp.]
MAEYKTTVALEIGAQSVTMGVFTPAGKGYALSRYARRDILLDPVEEGMRMDYVSNAIGEMVTELKVKGSDVRNVVSGQQVFMRFIKLPLIDIDDISEHVGYEAQQHIPFPLEDIIYSYQVLPEREPGEQEVLLVAIKKDVLDNLNTQVEDNGLKTRSVDCSITSLYNAYRISYPEDEGESVVILDIGAKTTDIIFSESGRFFTRSVTAAGSFITNNIAREFNLNFKEAEQLKIESGMVSLGNGFTDNMTEQEAALATTIRTAMSRLSSEVQRTINHYRAQYKGTAPTKAYICGGGARLPYAVEFLQAALNIPVEYLNPLNAFSIGAKVDEEALGMDALCLGPIAGAAVTGAKVGEFYIDLVPTSVGKDRAELQMLPKIMVGGLIALAGAGAFVYMAGSAQKEAEETDALFKRQLAPIEKDANAVAAAEEEFNSATAELRKLSSLYRRRTEYSDIIKSIAEVGTSYKFWFTQFEPVYTENLSLDQTIESASVNNHTRLFAPSSANGATAMANVESGYINALYIKGYAMNEQEVRDAYEKICKQKYFNSEEADKNKHVQIITNDSGSNAALGYLKSFHMILPLNDRPHGELYIDDNSEDVYLSVPEYRSNAE